MKKIKLGRLPFHLDDLEPIVSRETMETHYFGHHKGYVDKYNKLIKNPKPSSNHDKKLKFNLNGHILHSLYWENLIPSGSFGPSPFLKNHYNGNLVQDLFESTLDIMGSGWGLLVATKRGDVQIKKIQNHNLSNHNPICVIDFWEHAYYIDYRNNKKEFLANFMSLVNWDIVEDRLRAL